VITYGVRDRTVEPGGTVGDVVEMFPTRAEAEQMVAEAIQDEPDMAERLEVVEIELAGDSRN
jgi:hypothetical protein